MLVPVPGGVLALMGSTDAGGMALALNQIKNFARVDAGLATAGQPSEAELCLLRDEGFEEVVNLGLLDPRYCLEDEAGSVHALGMGYQHIPVDFGAPELSDYERFEQTMLDRRDRKVFVHCAMNYRVSCFTALYGEAHLGWSREQADAWIERQWRPDPVWTAFVERVRAGNR